MKKWGNQIKGLKAHKKSPASPLFTFSYIIEGNKKPRFVALRNSTYLMGTARLLLKRKKIQVGAAPSKVKANIYWNLTTSILKGKYFFSFFTHQWGKSTIDCGKKAKTSYFQKAVYNGTKYFHGRSSSQQLIREVENNSTITLGRLSDSSAVEVKPWNKKKLKSITVVSLAHSHAPDVEEV